MTAAPWLWGTPGLVDEAEPVRPARRAEPKEEEFKTLDEVQRDHVMQTLRRLNWNKTQAAQALGVSRATVINMLKRYSVPTW